MLELDIPREVLDPLSHAPVLFDALVGEEENACVFRKTVTLSDPGVQPGRRRVPRLISRSVISPSVICDTVSTPPAP